MTPTQNKLYHRLEAHAAAAAYADKCVTSDKITNDSKTPMSQDENATHSSYGRYVINRLKTHIHF